MNLEKQSTNLQMTLREVNRVGEGQKNVPKLRFKGYEEAWKQSELGEVLSELYNGQTPSRFHEENWNGDINWLTSGELNRDTVYKTIEKITRIGQVDANLRIVPEGIFVMAITGLEAAGTRGNCAILGIPTTLNQSCMALFPKDNVLFTGFLFQWYKKNGEKYGLVYTQGTKQRSYNAELIKKLPIAFPDYDEQKRLSTILRKLDNNLTLYQNRIEGLQKMKKTILSKMFPKDGEDVPEIRFKGFTDAWEQRKLADVSVINPKGEIPTTFKYVDLESVLGTSLLGYKIESKESAPSRAQRVAKKGDIFYQTVRPYQKNNYYFCSEEEDYVFSTGYAQIRPNCSGLFLFTYLQLDGFVLTVLNNCTGTSYPAINSKVLSDLNIRTPQILEQEKIGDIFNSLENIITLHQRKLDELKNMKKTLLQQMFV